MLMRRFARILAVMAIGAGGFAGQSATGQETTLYAKQETPGHWLSEGWSTDFSRATIPFWDVTDVIGRDNIPWIDDPQFEEVSNNIIIPGNEPVIGFEINGDARAYPLRIMMWHEIVNDFVGNVPVAVTFCPLCNTSIVFDRKIEGEVATFGTSGKLRNSDLIMYDRTTQSWWQQFDGNALAGIHAGKKLKAYPSRLMSLDLFKQEYPEGQMLLPDPRRISQLGRNPYAGYDSTFKPFLFRGEMPEDINGMVRVILVQGEKPFAIALPKLSKDGKFEKDGLYFSWSAGQASALDTVQISRGRDVGNIKVVDENGNPVVHEITFAFAARAFLPDLEIIQ
ncbi:DUF3179 domain-containing protein [uncultured Maritalea sp.]|uniref:DUF3179 domain-containing protein n=1 Tax=uncultured Maritalea sp. TaxID=757249 RepID=UPI00261AAD35|nr:DUF3179 domain-containing protein [uncultured Maritalea sp.]